MSKNERGGAERRKAKRRSILGTFSLFAVIPKKGIHKLQIYDVSDLGMRFDLDIEGEAQDGFKIQAGESIGLRLYLNQSLYLPLDVKVARIETQGEQRIVGGEFSDRDSRGYKAFVAFLAMLDQVMDIAQIDPQLG